MMPTRVYMTVPNGDAWIHKMVHFATIKVLADPRIRTGELSIRHDCPTHTPYVDNLHACMWDFLDNGDDFWLSMDDDNPPLANPLDLVAEDLDIVGFPTPIWHSEVPGDRPWYFNALVKVEDGYKPADIKPGLQEVDAIGCGCFLIARRVLQVMKMEQPFARQWTPKGRAEVGCDYSFCTKAKAHGFRVWVHSDYMANHFNELPLIEVIQRFAQMYEKIDLLEKAVTT